MKEQRVRVAALSIIAVIAMAGCGTAVIPDDEAARDITVRLERAFPVLEELRVGSYLVDERCSYIGYRRGAYSSDLDELQCWVVTYPDPVRMDEQAVDDFDRVKEAFTSAGLTVDYVGVDFDLAERIAEGSFFNVGQCSYFYEPAWSALPIADGDGYDEDADIAGINADWWRVC